MSQIQNYPVINMPFLYKSGLVIKRIDETHLLVSPGQCRDANDVMDMVVGGANVQGFPEPMELVLDATRTGVNALDIGALSTDTMYAVFLIADSRGYLPTACIATVAKNADSLPLIPKGYDSYRLIGYWMTDRGAGFRDGHYVGMNNDMTFVYSQAIGFYFGNETSPTNVGLAGLVPPVDYTLLTMSYAYNPDSAGDVLNLGLPDYGAPSLTVIGQVSGISLNAQCTLLTSLVLDVPSINYSVAGGDSVEFNINAFSVSV
jgi:hypothetical protein